MCFPNHKARDPSYTDSYLYTNPHHSLSIVHTIDILVMLPKWQATFRLIIGVQEHW